MVLRLGLKQLIKQQKAIALQPVNAELTLPGEPLIYSCKYSIGERKHPVQYFRNIKWKSILKSHFKSYYNTKTPVVLQTTFYVSPPSHIDIPFKTLKGERMPATMSSELCEYFLSFAEMIHHTLINSYRQIVKVEMEKFYSHEPRTVFKFMKWESYEKLQNNNSFYSESKSICSGGQVWILQPEYQGNIKSEKLGKGSPIQPKLYFNERPIACDLPLSNPTAPVRSWKKTPTAKLPTPRKET